MKTENLWRADIQGLRGLAVLLVLLFHADLPVPGGFIGVDVFFVLSGYVVTQMILREFRSTGSIDVREFFIRRFRRLAPAVGVLLSVVLLVTVVIGSPLETDTRTGLTALGAIAVSANFVIASQSGDYFDTAAELNPLLHLWSLAVEEQFYLLFPFIFIAATLGRRRVPGYGPLVFALTLLAAASFRLALGTGLGSVFRAVAGGTSTAFYLLPARAWEFLVGALLALAVGSGVPAKPLVRGFLATAGVAALIAGSLAIDPSVVQFPGPWTLLPVLATAAILSGSGAGLGMALQTRPMVWLGNISYSLYLWHWPMVVIAKREWPGLPAVAVLATTVAIVPAVVSYRLLEEPFRRRPPGSPSYPVSTRLAAVIGVAVPMLLSAVFLGGVSRAWGVPTLQEAKSSFETRHVAYTSGCATAVPPTERDLTRCWWGTRGESRPVVLVGDSNAEHFSGAVIDASARLDRPALILIQRGCPFTGAEVARSMSALEQSANGCRRFVAEILDILSGLEPSDVIIAFSDQYWLEEGWLTSTPELKPAVDYVSRLAHLERGLAGVLDGLADQGHHTIFVETVPHLHYTGRLSDSGFETEAWSIESCSTAALFVGRCERSVPLATVEEIQGAAWRTARRVIELRPTAVQYLSLREQLCPGFACVAKDESGWLYRDSTHLTVDAAARTARTFEAALNR